MTTAQAEPYSHTIIDAGVDWITCTARGKAARGPFKAETDAILREEASRGVEVTQTRLRDYVGWKAPGVITGTRAGDDICVLSSSHAARLWQRVAQHATNVSRLDLQATIWTHGEQPALSRWYYQRLKRAKPSRGRPRSFSLIQTHPHGDTLYVGKRQSDCFGRVYDYASAHKSAEPRTVWRYEVEFKRAMAGNHSRALLGERDTRRHAESVVASWFERRGVHSTALSSEFLGLQDVFPSPVQGDVLLWFETSLSKTIAKAIARNGVGPVFDALHLSQYLVDNPRGGQTAYANHPKQALHDSSHRRAREPTDYNDVLGQGSHGEPGIDSSRGACGPSEWDDLQHHTRLPELRLFEVAREPSPYSRDEH